MIATLHNFFYMGGYGFYVWTSYGSVCALLAWHWFSSRRRWQKYLRQQKKSS